MSSVTASYDALVAQVGKGEVSAEVMQKVAMLVDNLGNRNFPGATQIQAVSLMLVYVLCMFTVYIQYHGIYFCLFTHTDPPVRCFDGVFLLYIHLLLIGFGEHCLEPAQGLD